MSETRIYNAAVAAVEMPARVRSLPVSDRGYPVPWFVKWIDGVPDFRVADSGKLVAAVKRQLCWVCGGPLGTRKAAVIGPMCAITRTISDPPSHRGCGIFAAQACPFLANPRMRRRETDLPEQVVEAPGVAIKRNPGAAGVWITRSITPFRVDQGILFEFGEPDEVLWFAQGRSATREEVQHSIDTGLHLLQAEAEGQGPAAVAELHKRLAEIGEYLPC